MGTGKIRWETVGDISEVYPGFSTGGGVEHDPEGTHQLVQIRHLTAGLPYRYRERDAFRIKPGPRAERYHLKPGDVLFMSRGTRNVASWLEAIPEAALAVTSLYVIRPSAGTDSGYLTWYLNQPEMQRKIAEIRTGAGAPIVQRQALLEIEMPVPPREQQRQIGQLGLLMVREQMLLQQLERRTDLLHGMASEQLARGLRSQASIKKKGKV